ncbi:WYL domain-containing protein [Paenibacillus kobensis]|uniref:WYL domain-containing protein n=1 Tax=Paenibacillus kobensis TaxID=59841 RepID=UPI000FD72F89|nr:WYL domain-containing protein [Paenibacillus kobensis]
MSLFDKIFNYQIISRLDETGSFALTSQERTWLRTMLGHPEAEAAFAPETLVKLRHLLGMEEAPDMDDAASSGMDGDVRDIIIEKARSRQRQVYHPLLRPLRRIMMASGGVRLTVRLKHGGIKENQGGLPCKLEYNMAKREWYLLWYDTRNRSLMSTRLHHIAAVEPSELAPERFQELTERVAKLMEARKKQAVIGILPNYNSELSRILYAFSCFEKSVSYDETADQYRIHVTYLADESEFLLSRIRFLGLRVRVLEGGHLKHRMRQTASWALARYQTEDA